MDAVTQSGPVSGFDLNKLAWIHSEDHSDPACPIDLWTAVVGGDAEAARVDFIVKWEAGSFCPYHRHLGDAISIVLEGEHHITEMIGGQTVHKIRPPGHYGCVRGGSAHMEYAGPEGSLVFFSAQARDGKLFEILDKDENVLAVTTFDEMLDAIPQ